MGERITVEEARLRALASLERAEAKRATAALRDAEANACGVCESWRTVAAGLATALRARCPMCARGAAPLVDGDGRGWHGTTYQTACALSNADTLALAAYDALVQG